MVAVVIDNSMDCERLIDRPTLHAMQFDAGFAQLRFAQRNRGRFGLIDGDASRLLPSWLVGGKGAVRGTVRGRILAGG
jgi:hypothetical protein